MIAFSKGDKQMIQHITDDVMCDRMLEQDGYTEEDERTVGKLNRIVSAPGTVLVIDGREQTAEEAMGLLRQIVEAELDNWVPDASQRLIRRAAAALDLALPLHSVRTPITLDADHGPDRADHPLSPNWVGGVYVMQCVTCGHLFRH